MTEFDSAANALEALIVRINRTNSTTKINQDQTFADLLAKRDVLKLSHQIYSALATAASENHDRYSRSEIKYVSTVNVAGLRKKIDDLARDIRLTDIIIQEHNWKVELL